MFYLILAITSSALISIIMRISSGKTSGLGMLAVNYLTCIAIACGLTGVSDLIPRGDGASFSVILGVLNGILYLSGFAMFQLSVKKNGVVMSSTFMKLGLLVPMIVSICFFGEVPNWMQIIGFLLAITAILLINLQKEESALSFKAGLILLLLFGGAGDAMSKIFEELGDPAYSEQFLLYTFASACLFCVPVMLYKREKICKGDLLYGFLIGIPNYFSARFLLLSLETVDAVVVYPTYSLVNISVLSVVGMIFFREKLNRKQLFAIALILLSLILLNI